MEHNGSLFSFNAIQGEAIKRPGTVFIQVKIHDNEPVEVRISGTAVIAFVTELVLP